MMLHSYMYVNICWQFPGLRFPQTRKLAWMIIIKVIRSNVFIAVSKETQPKPTPPPSKLSYHLINSPTTVNYYSIITSMFL